MEQVRDVAEDRLGDRVHVHEAERPVDEEDADRCLRDERTELLGAVHELVLRQRALRHVREVHRHPSAVVVAQAERVHVEPLRSLECLGVGDEALRGPGPGDPGVRLRREDAQPRQEVAVGGARRVPQAGRVLERAVDLDEAVVGGLVVARDQLEDAEPLLQSIEDGAVVVRRG
jgi:hypothetical protein